METIKDKMLKVISEWSKTKEPVTIVHLSEACARVAEEEIVRMLDLVSIEVDDRRSRNTILQLKDKYLKTKH